MSDPALHQDRMRLESIIVAACEECEQPITALDPACRSHIREPDGEQYIVWYHARCIGCDHGEAMREAGCPGCGREW